MAAQTGYDIKLTGPGLALEKNISEDLANRITLLVLSDGRSEEATALGNRGGTGKAGPGTSSSVGNKSVREYLLASKAEKIPQQMTAIGHYILETQKKENFTLAELLTGFGDAKESPPKNPHRDINLAIRRGWIALRERDSYYVTSTGITAIGGGFPKTRQKRRKKKKAVSAKAK